MRWLPLLLLSFILIVGFLITVNKYQGSKHFLLIILSLGYFIGLGVILFTPVSFDGSAIYIMPAGIGRVNKTRLYLHGLGFIENIILTIPLGLILKKLVKQMPIIVIAVLGVIISSMIEIVQYYLSQQFLINRSSDINDIFANTLGIIIGAIGIATYQNLKTSQNID